MGEVVLEQYIKLLEQAAKKRQAVQTPAQSEAK